MPKIIVDERERASKIPQILSRLGDYIVYKMLDVGDYIVANTIAVERKSASDLVKSIFDGRLFDQVRRLLDRYERAVILIQGSPSEIRLHMDRWQPIYGSLARLVVSEGISVIFSLDEEEAAYFIHSLAQKSQNSLERYPIVHKKPRLETLEEWQLHIVQSLPYIGPKLARRLLRRFGSVLAIFNASPSELSRIEGISEWKAQEIARILRSPYKSGNEGRNM
ncbi:MAG: ERCC4 domain-containing protein [Desulfurococcales archaeon]|jgi:DNA excision repair protein ERCC-4|nr:ERCC4 domain-containing protein [Desulfurococcales archaeon]